MERTIAGLKSIIRVRAQGTVSFSYRQCCGSGSGSTCMIRIKLKSKIRIRINMEMTSQNVRNMSLFEHFFTVLSIYLEAGIRIRIKVKVGSGSGSASK